MFRSKRIGSSRRTEESEELRLKMLRFDQEFARFGALPIIEGENSHENGGEDFSSGARSAALAARARALWH